MLDDNDLVRQRRRKLESLAAAGGPAYPNDFRVSHALADVRAAAEPQSPEALAADPARYAVAGRLMAVRSFGKMAFGVLRDRSGDLQIWFRHDRLLADAFEAFKQLVDIGDILGVTGPVTRTKTGELTLVAEQFRVLTKALRPLPEKFHGLQDTEARHRQRYVDLIVNPSVREVFAKRNAIVRYVRNFLDARGFMEVETPMMQPMSGGATARPFKTWHNALGIELFLRIAPELYLKRLVVGGLERVYELNRNFRNEGLSQTHNPEFTMLEFYWAYATYEDLMQLTEELLAGLVQQVCGADHVLLGDETLSFAAPFARLTMSDSLVTIGGVPAEALGDRERLLALAREADPTVKADLSLGHLIATLFEQRVEAQLRQPTFITQFPVEVSPLSRRNDADPRFVDRFELYAAGREIANAFSELNDPADQLERFREQERARQQGDEEAQLADLDYVRALEFGLPPTAGEGIGIDRLTMLLTGQDSIREVILFPHMRPEAALAADTEAP